LTGISIKKTKEITILLYNWSHINCTNVAREQHLSKVLLTFCIKWKARQEVECRICEVRFLRSVQRRNNINLYSRSGNLKQQ